MSTQDCLEAADEAAAAEALHALGCTDGLPVVVPTPERVERMVLAGGQDGTLSLGAMGPGGGDATVSGVAVAAVMAGCLPDHFPVVLAAVRAMLDPAFDLAEMQSTTHCTAPMLVVNGPAREACGGIASGTGCMGPGHRANACIGRALRLAMLNIGGGQPGVSDMALHGHPGKFSFCFAEAEEASPFPPLHVARGYAVEDSVVTVMGAEAPHSVIYSAVGDPARDAEALLHVLAAGLAGPASNNAVLTGGQAALVLNPEHAGVFAGAGLDRAAVQRGVHERTAYSVGELARWAGSFAREGDADKRIAAFREPEDILVLVAGGSGLYSMAVPTWCAGPHANRAVSALVDVGQVCAI